MEKVIAKNGTEFQRTKTTTNLYEKHSEYIFKIGSSLVKDFKLNQKEKKIYKNLLLYFLGSEKSELDLNKGIMLMGSVGTGKTTIMRIFKEYLMGIGSKRHYHIASARDVERVFAMQGINGIRQFVYNSYKDPRGMPQEKPAIYCFEDLGLENTSTKNYGNESNPMAEVLLDRYDLFISNALKTHVTTNLSPAELERLYDNRLRSRFREMFTKIIIEGQDKRK